MRISDWNSDVCSSDLLPPATADRIVHAYGTDARAWLGEAQDWDALGGEIAHGLSVAEVEWIVAREWARTADDILWRRSKLGLFFSAAEMGRPADSLVAVAAKPTGVDSASPPSPTLADDESTDRLITIASRLTSTPHK